MTLSRYRKTITAVVGGIITWAGTAYVPDGTVNREEWFALALALATAAGVYGIANATPDDGTGLAFRGQPIGHITVKPTAGSVQQADPTVPETWPVPPTEKTP